jgi:tRNA (guanine37-N1)-methyltransferase
MKVHIITNFTGAFTSYFDSSIMRIAREKVFLSQFFIILATILSRHSIESTINPMVDGAGALIEIEPMYRAITSIDPENRMKKIYLWPRWERLKQAKIEEIAENMKDEEFLILCGHYEWVDHRVFEIFAFEQYSIGDFVVSSGEIAAMVFLDAVVRLMPGVVWNTKSLHEESFSDALEWKPEYPQYTRPADFMGYKVPEVLLSGDHKKIEEWRKSQIG